jgi:hypothetical protein
MKLLSSAQNEDEGITSEADITDVGNQTTNVIMKNHEMRFKQFLDIRDFLFQQMVVISEDQNTVLRKPHITIAG